MPWNIQHTVSLKSSSSKTCSPSSWHIHVPISYLHEMSYLWEASHTPWWRTASLLRQRFSVTFAGCWLCVLKLRAAIEPVQSGQHHMCLHYLTPPMAWVSDIIRNMFYPLVDLSQNSSSAHTHTHQHHAHTARNTNQASRVAPCWRALLVWWTSTC